MPAAQRVRKQPTNVSLRADYARRAKELGINLSAVFEDAVENAIRDAEQKKWLEENDEAIRQTNEHTAKHGLFADKWRKF